MVARAFAVEIVQRGSQVRIGAEGEPVDAIRGAAAVVDALYDLVESGFVLGPTDVDHAIRLLRAEPGASLTRYFADSVLVGVGNKPIVPRTPNQRRYIAALRRSAIVFGIGPAGTGKTYLAVAAAVQALLKGDVKRLVLTRPAVEAGEKLGYLPGDLAEKVDPYLRPLFDAINDMVPPERFARLQERKQIEVAPLAFMRGRTLQDAWVVVDEGQNTTIEQMKMVLTRLGDASRMTITGDVTQIDLPHRRSGLIHALRILGKIDGIETIRFDVGDVVRHPLVAKIISAYEQAKPEEEP